MSSTPLVTSTTRRTSACSVPLQAVVAAVAVCVLYWAVGINETPASASGSNAPAPHLKQVVSTSVSSTLPAASSASGPVR